MAGRGDEDDDGDRVEEWNDHLVDPQSNRPLTLSAGALEDYDDAYGGGADYARLED